MLLGGPQFHFCPDVVQKQSDGARGSVSPEHQAVGEQGPVFVGVFLVIFSTLSPTY